MAKEELVYALAVTPACESRPWHARLVCAEGGAVAEFDTLSALVRYLAEASLPGPLANPEGIR